MLAVSFDLVHEGQPYGPGMVVVGLIIGIIFIKQSQEYLKQFDDLTVFSNFTGTSKRKSLLVLAVMTLHAFGEGSGVGVSYSGQEGWKQVRIVRLLQGLMRKKSKIWDVLFVGSLFFFRCEGKWKPRACS